MALYYKTNWLPYNKRQINTHYIEKRKTHLLNSRNYTTNKTYRYSVSTNWSLNRIVINLYREPGGSLTQTKDVF